MTQKFYLETVSRKPGLTHFGWMWWYSRPHRLAVSNLEGRLTWFQYYCFVFAALLPCTKSSYSHSVTHITWCWTTQYFFQTITHCWKSNTSFRWCKNSGCTLQYVPHVGRHTWVYKFGPKLVALQVAVQPHVGLMDREAHLVSEKTHGSNTLKMVSTYVIRWSRSNLYSQTL